MTNKEAGPQSESLVMAECFLNNLYQEILNDQKDKGAQIIKEFNNQEIVKWDRSTDDAQGSLDLIKGVFMRDDKKDFVLVLGRGKRSRYETGLPLRLLFGLTQKGNSIESNIGTGELGHVINQPFTWGDGEFYQNGNNLVEVNCWANRRAYGGEEIKIELEKKELNNGDNLKSCLRVVQRVAAGF